MKWGKSYHPEGLRSSAVLMGQEMQVVFKDLESLACFSKAQGKVSKGG